MGAQGEGRPERIILGDPKFQVKKNRVTIDKIVASTFSESIISIASIRENDAMTFLCQDSLGEMLDKFQAQFLFAAGALGPPAMPPSSRSQFSTTKSSFESQTLIETPVSTGDLYILQKQTAQLMARIITACLVYYPSRDALYGLAVTHSSGVAKGA